MVKFDDDELEAVQRLADDGFSSVTGLYRRFDALDGFSLSQAQFSSRLKGSIDDLDLPLWFEEYRPSYFVDSAGSGKKKNSSRSLPASPHPTPSFLAERLAIRRRFITHPDFPLALEDIAELEVEEFNARHIPENHLKPVQVVALKSWMRKEGYYASWKNRMAAWDASKEQAEREHWEMRLGRVLDLAKVKGPQYEAAALLVAAGKFRKALSASELVQAFRIRYESEARGKKLPLTQIGERMGKNPVQFAPQLGRVYKAAGWAPAYGNQKKLTVEQRTRSVEAYRSTSYPVSLIAHFLSINHSSLAMHFRRVVSKTERASRKKMGFADHGSRLSYIQASRVYAAVDLGLSGDVVQDVLGVSEGRYGAALSKREEIEQGLVGLLGTLGPGVEHDKPYVVLEKDHRPRTLIQMMLDHPTDVPVNNSQIYKMITGRGITLSTGLFYRCLREHDFSYPSTFNHCAGRVKRDFLRDSLIQLGVSPAEISRSEKENARPDAASTEAIAKYITRSGQHDLWSAARLKRQGSFSNAPLNPFKQVSISRSYSVPLDRKTIAYLLETDNKTVWRYLDKMPPRENYAGEICRVKNTGAENRLTHIKAIKAYEAMDAGFTRAEICEYAGISSDVLVVARDRKEELEKVYVSAIKTIFDASDHDKPYVTPKLRQKLKV